MQEKKKYQFPFLSISILDLRDVLDTSLPVGGGTDFNPEDGFEWGEWN